MFTMKCFSVSKCAFRPGWSWASVRELHVVETRTRCQMTIDMTVSLLHMRGMHVQYHVPVNLFINSYSCTVARYRARGRIPSRLESWASEFRSHTPRAQDARRRPRDGKAQLHVSKLELDVK